MISMAIQKGDTVQWVSQAQGSEKVKRGTVHAVVPARYNPNLYLPRDITRSQIKFDGSNANYTRYIVAVPRGGRSTVTDYYCPKPGALEKVLDEGA